jgi:hypothetical protein
MRERCETRGSPAVPAITDVHRTYLPIRNRCF